MKHENSSSLLYFKIFEKSGKALEWQYHAAHIFIVYILETIFDFQVAPYTSTYSFI